MLIYLILLAVIVLVGLICFSAGITPRKKRIFCNITIVLIALVECLRDVSIGEDTSHYVEWFREYCDIKQIRSLSHPWRDVELGYSLINIILSRITHNPQVLIAVISILIVSLHMKFIEKNSKDPLLSVLLFFGLNFFLTSMVSWRQFIMMGIIFWMYPLLLKRKYFKALLIFLVAMLFHDTAIIFAAVLLVAVLFSRCSRGSLWILLLCLITVPFIDVILQGILKILPSYQIYFSTIRYNVGMGTLRAVYMVAETVMLLVVVYRLSARRPKSGTAATVEEASAVAMERRKLAVLATMMAFAVYCGFLSMYIPYVFRLGYYFDYFVLLLVPELMPKKARAAFSYKVLVAVLCIILFIYYLSTNAGQTVPYQFFF